MDNNSKARKKIHKALYILGALSSIGKGDATLYFRSALP